MTEPVTPAAAPAAPAAPAPAAPAAKPAESLLPAAAPVAPAAAAPAPAAPAAPAPAQKWFYSEGVEGKGSTPPDWFKSSKYVTVEEQAKAYVGLEKRLGSFTGAPDGEYVVTVPDKYKDAIQVDTTNPVFKSLNEWGKKHQLSQDGFSDVIGMLAEYEASVATPPRTKEDALKEIGPNAEVRINAVAQFVTANLDGEGQAAVREALSVNNLAIAQTLTAIERVIAKSRQPKMPKPGADIPAPSANELAEINAMQAKVGSDGKRLYTTDSAYRAQVEARRQRFFAAQNQQ